MGAKAKGDAIAEPVAISDAERRRAPRVLVDLEVDYASIARLCAAHGLTFPS